MKSHKVKSGELVRLPLRKNVAIWAIQCCDCSLRHVVLIRRNKHSVSLAAWRYDEILDMLLPKGGKHDK